MSEQRRTFRETNGLLSIDELCDYFQVSKSYLTQFIRCGAFDGMRVRMGSRWLYDLKSIEQFFLCSKK